MATQGLGILCVASGYDTLGAILTVYPSSVAFYILPRPWFSELGILLVGIITAMLLWSLLIWVVFSAVAVFRTRSDDSDDV